MAASPPLVFACPPCPRRPLAPHDVLRAARGQPVPGLPPDLARALGRCRLPNLGWLDFDRARRSGWLLLAPAPHRPDLPALANLWGWWRLAARRPEAVVRSDLRQGTADVALDLSPAGLAWAPAALEPIGRACLAWGASGTGWLVTPDACQVDGLTTESASGLAADLLAVAADRRLVAREAGSGRGAALWTR